MRNLLTLLLLCSALPSFGAQYARDLRVETPLMLRELGASPTGITGYGQLYTKTLDNDLYFMDSLGNQFNVLLGGAAGAQLNDLSDVDTFTASATNNQVLTYNGSLWVPKDPAGKALNAVAPIVINQDTTSATFSLGTFNLDDLSDVNTSGVVTDQVLAYNGTSWGVKDSGGASFAGAVTVPSITDNGGGSVTVGAIDVVLFDNATQVGTAKKYSLPALTVTLVDNSTNYIIADYAGGSPALANTTNVSLINESSVVPIYTIYRSGSYLHIQSWDSLGNGLANKLHQSIVKTQRYRRESGLALGEMGAMNVTVSSGIVWTGANPVSVLSVNSLTDNLIYFQRTGASSWSPITQSVYNNLEYFNGTTSVTLTNNRYAVNWVYRGIESQKHIYIVAGEGDYSLPQAQASQPPANLPSQITSHALLVGRIIVLKGAVVATQIDSAFSLTFAGSSVTDHNSLLNLQGGTTGEYYHLTAAEDTAVASLSGTTTNYVLKRSATGFANSQIFDNGTNVGIGTTNPSAAKLVLVGDMNATYTATNTASGSTSPYLFTLNINPSSTSSTEFRALGFSSTIQGSSQMATVRGGYFEVRNTGSGTITTATGISSTGMVFPSTSQNFGPISDVISFLAVPINSFSNTVTGTISNARGLRVNNAGLTSNQTLTNFIGVSLDALTSGTNNTYILMGQNAAPTGNFGIYNASANNNYFNGSIGIGNTAPATKLHVTGDITVTGYQYFGLPTVDGSFRMYVSGGALKIEKRISGTWTSVGQFDEL